MLHAELVNPLRTKESHTRFRLSFKYCIMVSAGELAPGELTF